MPANERIINAKTHRQKIKVMLDDEELLCTVTYNPRSAIFLREMARLAQALSGVGTLRGINIPSLPEISDGDEGALDALDAAAGAFGGIADAFDALVAASDKIIGSGVTDAILAEDDENLTLFNAVYAPIFEEYVKVRSEKMDKYRATPKAATGSTLPEIIPTPDTVSIMAGADADVLE